MRNNFGVEWYGNGIDSGATKDATLPNRRLVVSYKNRGLAAAAAAAAATGSTSGGGN